MIFSNLRELLSSAFCCRYFPPPPQSFQNSYISVNWSWFFLLPFYHLFFFYVVRLNYVNSYQTFVYNGLIYWFYLTFSFFLMSRESSGILLMGDVIRVYCKRFLHNFKVWSRFDVVEHFYWFFFLMFECEFYETLAILWRIFDIIKSCYGLLVILLASLQNVDALLSDSYRIRLNSVHQVGISEGIP